MAIAIEGVLDLGTVQAPVVGGQAGDRMDEARSSRLANCRGQASSRCDSTAGGQALTSAKQVGFGHLVITDVATQAHPTAHMPCRRAAEGYAALAQRMARKRVNSGVMPAA